MSLFFGYHMPNFSFEGVPDAGIFDRVVELAQAAEANGFDMVTVMDHFYQIGGVGPEEAPMLEGYTTLGALATRTDRVLLGTMVTGVTYRNPAMVAKMTTTLDIISKGRAVLGLGAAWNEAEHVGYGFEFPPIGRRLDRLEEALAICKAMITEERPSFEGRYYRIERALNSPRPIQPNGPKIMVGGGGEKRTLRLAAMYADITNWFGGLEEAAPKLAILDRHCQDVGRDPATILRTISVPLLLVENERDKKAALEGIPVSTFAPLVPATVDEAVEIIGGYADAGFGGIILRNLALRTPESIAMAGEVIRTLRS